MPINLYSRTKRKFKKQIKCYFPLRRKQAKWRKAIHINNGRRKLSEVRHSKTQFILASNPHPDQKVVINFHHFLLCINFLTIEDQRKGEKVFSFFSKYSDKIYENARLALPLGETDSTTIADADAVTVPGWAVYCWPHLHSQSLARIGAVLSESSKHIRLPLFVQSLQHIEVSEVCELWCCNSILSPSGFSNSMSAISLSPPPVTALVRPSTIYFFIKHLRREKAGWSKRCTSK